MPTNKGQIVLDYIRAKENKRICETAPFPSCNGANGCDSCQYQEEEQAIKDYEEVVRGVSIEEQQEAGIIVAICILLVVFFIAVAVLISTIS